MDNRKTEWNRSGDKDKDGTECTFLSRNEITLNGNITYDENTRFNMWLISNESNVNMNGTLHAQTLIVAAGHENNIYCNGTVDCDGQFCAMRGKRIETGESADISCNAFECNSMDSTVRNIEEMTINGCIRVNGHAHCCVDSVLLSETGLLSITSDDENENVVFKDLTSVTFNGKLQLNTKGDCIFDCKQSILMNKNCKISLAVNRCILSASQTIEMKNPCRIEVERGKLYLTNAKDGEQEIHGLVLLSGEIIGKFQQYNTESCTDAMVDNPARSELEVEGKNVHVCGLVLGNFHSVDLFAAMDFSVDLNSCVQIGANLEIQATNIELQGKISQIQKTKILAQSSLKVRGESKISKGTFLEIMTETVEIKGDILGR